MEVTKKLNIGIVFSLLTIMLVGCSKDEVTTVDEIDTEIAEEEIIDENTSFFYYLADEGAITKDNIGAGNATLEPSGIAIANGKLYIADKNSLNVLDAKTLEPLERVTTFTKEGEADIALGNLTSIAVDEGRIYIGSSDSRIFVFDEDTLKGIGTIGNGQWHRTLVHAFGVTVGEGLIFVKEKVKSIKVFEVSQVTNTSHWDLEPIAKLNTLNGKTEKYAMAVENEQLVVAGRDAKSYLYYDFKDIRDNGAASITTPLEPEVSIFTEEKPLSLNLGEQWAITCENIGGKNKMKIYLKSEFMQKIYLPKVDASDILTENPFGAIQSIAQFGDKIFLADEANQQVRVITLKKSKIQQQ